MLPPTVRDPLAARAFIAEWGDKGRALVRLGFAPLNRLPPDKVHLYNDYSARVFETPGVQAILLRDLARPRRGSGSDPLAADANGALRRGRRER